MSERLSADGLSEEEIRKNFETVRAHIAELAEGRQVVLLAATKTVSADRINFAASELGLTDIGENRVQELLSKYDELDLTRLKVHFIGRLQTNKVKYIIDKVCLIHSLDSIGLAREIEKQAGKIGQRMDVLVEVNLEGEPTKGGIPESELDSFLAATRDLTHLRVCGIMVIPPATSDQLLLHSYFGRAKSIYDRLWASGGFECDHPILSMGMSDSYCPAIACGSTLVRIGSALFGRRNYQK